MIAKDNFPFQTVENEGFQYLLKTVAPLYKLPGRKSITKLMEEKYELLSMIIKEKLLVVDYNFDIRRLDRYVKYTELLGNDYTLRIEKQTGIRDAWRYFTRRTTHCRVLR
ncbi:unnamed protein product [Lasius platythorax]|uniref:Uncharacterized protein n=1 Tax=Lasius platythorax TaxID=488582 RepID=A0AAV2P6N9_9HYME